MPITSDQSSLPANGGAGIPPVKHPIVVHKLAEAWYDDYLGNDHHVPAARWWASMAGMCARSVGYQIREADAKRQLARLTADQRALDEGAAPTETDVDLAAALVVSLAATNPPSMADAWRMGLGTMVHRQLQEILPQVFPGAEAEVRVTLDELDGSARADAVLKLPERTELRHYSDGDSVAVIPAEVVALELKTMNGFGYKMATTTFKGTPEGPKANWITQGALAAEAVDADRLIIGVLSLECISPDIAARNHLSELGRFAAEWHFTKEQYLPYARRERTRAAKIIALVDDDQLPPRHHPEIPAGARITDPSTGAWAVADAEGRITGAGKTWVCAYCWHRDRCLADGPS